MPDKTQKQMIIEMYGTLQRLDERTEAQEKHLEAINGSGKSHTKRITRLEITEACLITALVSTGVLENIGVINVFG